MVIPFNDAFHLDIVQPFGRQGRNIPITVHEERQLVEHRLDRSVCHSGQENNPLVEIVLSSLYLQQPQQREAYCISLSRSCRQH